MKDDTAQIFDWQGIRIEQDEVVHKVGTDSILLGAWVKQIVPDAFDILDAGTGSGVLCLMASRHYPLANIKGVDIDEASLRLASRNVTAMKGGEAIEIACENILFPQEIPSRQYDLVMSNPPFYSAQILPAKDYKARAKHMAGPLSAWVNGLIRRVAPNGNLCIIVPFESAAQWITAANESGYYNINRLDVFSFVEDLAPKRSILHLSARLERPSINHLWIYAKDKTYTPEYLKLTGIRSTV
jgi:tRNA1Val (adenine37-N6)-methyltransferase